MRRNNILFTSHDDSVGNIVLDSGLYPVSDFLQSLKIYPLSKVIIMLGIYYSTIALWSTDSILLTSSESLEHETVTILTYFMKRSFSNKCRGSIFIIHVAKTTTSESKDSNAPHEDQSSWLVGFDGSGSHSNYRNMYSVWFLTLIINHYRQIHHYNDCTCDIKKPGTLKSSSLCRNNITLLRRYIDILRKSFRFFYSYLICSSHQQSSVYSTTKLRNWL